MLSLLVDGDQVAALKTIKAKTIVLPALKDLYFPPEDEEYAVSHNHVHR